MDSVVYDAAIIGGGAAGLTAAIVYGRQKPGGRLLLIEANDEPGKKILATGNGRCNISSLSADDYQEIKEFFRGVGVLFRIEDGGRAYPMSGQAASVRDALVCALGRLQVEVRCGTRVTGICRGKARADDGDGGGNSSGRIGSGNSRVRSGSGSSDGIGGDGAAGDSAAGFGLQLEGGEAIRAKKVLIATGGKAGPQYGCFGDGYAFARSLGHSVESIRPALVPLVYTEAERERLAGLKGVRIRSQAELLTGGRRTAASSGELQFTDYGLSGVMVFDLSTMMPKSIIEGRPRIEIAIDLAPGEERDALERLMEENTGLWLEGVVGKKLSDLLVREGEGDRKRIAALAKNFVIAISGTKGWKEAQATLGGVRTSEIGEKTGESLICKGLYFAGEVLEPVYICGGFNLNHAWATGLRAGSHM